MKFYDCSTAPSPRRVRIFAAEKGLKLDTVQVDLGSGEQFSDAFREINPDCAVPVLELDDGTRLSEVFAICQYLEELQPEPALLGNSAVERAQVTMWNTKIEQQGLLPNADAFRNTVKGMKGHAVTGPDSFAQIPELAARGRARVSLFLDKMNQHLADRAYVVGENFSLADITLLVVMDFTKWTKIPTPDDAEHLKRWYESVAGRASAAA